MKRIMVISPHPDDETLGAGGTLARMKGEGAEILWLNVTQMSKETGYTQEQIEKRELEIEQVLVIYDCLYVDGYFPPACLNDAHMGKLIGIIKDSIDNFKPDTLIIPFMNDPHSDHQIVAKAALSASKQFRAPSIKRTLMMEIISETDFAPAISGQMFVPNFYVDITNHYDIKEKALAIYDSEMGEYPFPRSFANVFALATHRGTQAGCNLAEAFMLIKEVY